MLSFPFHTKITILRKIKQRERKEKKKTGQKKKMRKKKTHFKQK